LRKGGKSKEKRSVSARELKETLNWFPERLTGAARQGRRANEEMAQAKTGEKKWGLREIQQWDKVTTPLLVRSETVAGKSEEETSWLASCKGTTFDGANQEGRAEIREKRIFRA